MRGALVGVLLVLLGPAAAGAQEVRPDDMVLGQADAPVTIIEYASLTCPHCASFHVNTLPELKEEYIDTGKVRLVFRDFPFDEPALRAAQLAHCGGPERYFGYLEVLFRQQGAWAVPGKAIENLQQIAKLGGMSTAEFKACMANKQIEEAVLKGRLQGQREFDITSTPSFIINGKKIAGTRSFEEMKEIIDPLLPADKRSELKQ